MNKEELEKEIAKTKEQLDKLQQELKDKEEERWKPRHRVQYFSVYANNKVFCHYNNKQAVTNESIEVFNCFQTKEQAEIEAEKILVRRMLENIARRLNKNKTLNWKSQCQHKYSIYFDYREDKIDTYPTTVPYKEQGAVYCLEQNFKDIATQEIGEERLIRYLKG